jgi:uncharacterized membrane protein YbhN (UPF0104 family)
MKQLLARVKETYNSNKYVKIGVRVLISGVLIFYLLSTQNIPLIIENLKKFNLWFLLGALGTSLLGTYISSIRWGLILNTSDKTVSQFRLFCWYVKGYFYNNFLPTQMGGDVYKAIAVGNNIHDQSLGVFSVFMDRFGGLIALLILGFFGIASLFGPQYVFVAMALILVGMFLYFPILHLFSKKIKFFQKFEEASNLLLKHKKEAILIIALSFLVQAISFLGIYLLFLGIGVHLPFWSVIAFMPIASLSALIPSFNGFGTQETVFAFLFANAGVTAELSIVVSVMLHVVRLIMSLLGGILIMLDIPKEEKPR